MSEVGTNTAPDGTFVVTVHIPPAELPAAIDPQAIIADFLKSKSLSLDTEGNVVLPGPEVVEPAASEETPAPPVTPAPAPAVESAPATSETPVTPVE